MNTFELRPQAPYDWDLIMRRPCSRPSGLFAYDAERRAFTSSLQLGAAAVPFTVQSVGSVDAPALRVTLPAHLSIADKEVARRAITRGFGVDVDIAPILAHMAQFAPWRPWLDAFAGLRLFVDVNPFACMVKTIIGQQLNISFAATLVERLVGAVGQTMSWNGAAWSAFPGPQAVAELTYESLQALSFSRRKAEYVIDFARSIASGTLDLAVLEQLPDEDVIATLSQQRGIGRWTGECFLLFAFGRPDLFPAADIGVLNGIRQIYGSATRPTPDEARVIAEPWGPWRSYATYYLWQSLIK